jgi:hypothetical protein
MEKPDNESRLLKKWELLFLLIAVVFILFTILQKYGIHVVEVTDDSQFIQ